MGQQDVVAGLHEQAAVAGLEGEAIGTGGALPVFEEAGRVLCEGDGERAHGFGEGGVMAVSDADADGEIARSGQVHLPHDGQVAVRGGAELPVHTEIFS